jgi:hypothetical protein
MTDTQDDSASNPAISAFQPIVYRGLLIEREVVGRIGRPPGRPLYHYSCEIYRRRLARPTLDELKKAIDEMMD